jgi:hypothetical protein
MNVPPESGIQKVCKHWLNAATTLLACQWKLFEVQYQAGLKIMEAALGAPGRGVDVGSPAAPERSPDIGPAKPDEVGKLERLAAERVSQGLAPPREVYQSPYRTQIDWGKFPAWARPSDPDMFEGCGHEG